MTERRQEDVETPERTHDQPAEGGREQADQANQQSMNEPDDSGTAPEQTA
jgi:hypothetical protein